MQYHLEVMGKKVRETFAYTDFESLEIYGEPNDELRAWIGRVSEGVPFTLHEMRRCGEAWVWCAVHGPDLVSGQRPGLVLAAPTATAIRPTGTGLARKSGDVL